jgi:hypothetical protein
LVFRWLFLLGSVAMVPLSGAVEAGNEVSSSQGRGDLIAYHMAGLPDPVVIYAYDAKGVLLKVFGADGNNGFAGMEKMRLAIASGTIDAAADVAPDTDTKLGRFFASQGLKRENVLGGDTLYRLILVVPDTGGAACPPCENYRKMLADATTRPAAENRFSIYTLKLGTPGAVFRTAK